MATPKWILPILLCVSGCDQANKPAKETQAVAKTQTATSPTIILRVLPTGKIYIVPKTGDVIKWVDENDRTVHIHFPHKDRPCSDPDGSNQCTVTDATGLFNYSCKTDGGQVMCQDPGIDPNSGGGDLVPKVARAKVAGANVAAAHALTSKDITAMDIGCDDSGNNITVIDPNTGSSTPTIEHGSTIQWTAHAMTFNVSSLNPGSACAVLSVGSGRVQWCDSANKAPPQPYQVTYQVDVSGTGACTNTSGKFSFTVN